MYLNSLMIATSSIPTLTLLYFDVLSRPVYVKSEGHYLPRAILGDGPCIECYAFLYNKPLIWPDNDLEPHDLRMMIKIYFKIYFSSYFCPYLHV